MKIDVKPINHAEIANTNAGNVGAPVVPSSMAGSIKPDTANLPPAGYRRDEVLAQRRARLEAQIGELEESGMRGGVDVSTIPIENEIANMFDNQGNLSVSRQHPDYEYKWKRADDIAMTRAKNVGFEVVSGEPCSDKRCAKHITDAGDEYRGKGQTAGTSLRGHGDVILCMIPKRLLAQIEEYYRQKGIAMGQVVERLEDYGEELAQQGLTPRNLAHSRATDPLIQRVFANGPEQSREMGRVMKSGTLRGANADQIFAGRR